MATEPRLHIEFAAGSSMAAILRRGPTEWTRLLLWDTATDELTAGSWFHGRIYEDSCSISPDGTLFSYLAAKHSGNFGEEACDSWTAISKPPWLTAIAFWPQIGTQGIGTEFVDDSTLIISHPHWDELLPRAPLPDGFKVLSKFTGRGAPEQSLPKRAKSNAQFHNNRGIDQQNRAFEYEDGKLARNGEMIADLSKMKPEPERSPEWARSW